MLALLLCVAGVVRGGACLSGRGREASVNDVQVGRRDIENEKTMRMSTAGASERRAIIVGREWTKKRGGEEIV